MLDEFAFARPPKFLENHLAYANREIQFVLKRSELSQLPVGKPRIVGFNAKWVEDSIEYQATPRTFDFAASDRELLVLLQRLAKETWRLFAGTGYARVDFRVDQNNHPFILEFNANPCITSYGGFMAAAEQAGLSYNAAIARIIGSAC